MIPKQKPKLIISACYALLQTLTTFFTTTFFKCQRTKKMSAQENILNVEWKYCHRTKTFLMSTFIKMSTHELKNCRQHFFAVSKYFVSKQKIKNVCRWKKSQRTKIFFDVNILKLSAHELKKLSSTFLSEWWKKMKCFF